MGIFRFRLLFLRKICTQKPLIPGGFCIEGNNWGCWRNKKFIELTNMEISSIIIAAHNYLYQVMASGDKMKVLKRRGIKLCWTDIFKRK